MAESKRQFEALSGFAKERAQMSARLDQLCAVSLTDASNR